MRDIRAALVKFILDDVGINSAVGGTRVYPTKIPQGVKATCIVYTLVSGQSGHHMEGRDGLARIRLQIDAWSPSGDTAANLANLIKDRLDGFSGVMGQGDSAVNVQAVFFLDERESYDDGAQMSRMGRDYAFHFEEL